MLPLHTENVNEYLRLSANADKVQSQRIKNIFEKKNQKSTQSIAQLQKKLENYKKRLREVETYGVSGHKQAKEVLKNIERTNRALSTQPPASMSPQDALAEITQKKEILVRHYNILHMLLQ